MQAQIQFQILAAHAPDQLPTVRALFQEYWDSFGFTPCFQNFSEEVAGLPGKFAPPDGRMAVAWAQGKPLGCIAMRRLDRRRGEVKRLYLKPEFRGRGLGRALLEWMMNEARAIGYSEIVGDTMPVMRDALALYARMGFERTEAYGDQSETGAIALRLKL